MSASLERVKDNIRAMLNLARNDAASEGEIANALKFARRLMDAHHLEESDLDDDPHGRAGRNERMDMHTTGTVGGMMTKWELHLAKFVGDFVGGVGFYVKRRETKVVDGRVQFSENGKPRSHIPVVFYGAHEEAQLAASLFEELSLTIASVSRLRYGSMVLGEGRGYCQGFVDGLCEKLRESRREDMADVQTRSLILRAEQTALAKKENADNWLASSRGVKLRSRSRRYSSNTGVGDGYAQGRTDGRAQQVSAHRSTKIGSRVGRIGGWQ